MINNPKLHTPLTLPKITHFENESGNVVLEDEILEDKIKQPSSKIIPAILIIIFFASIIYIIN